MRRSDLGVIILTVLITLSVVALVLVGELRPDVYLSMSILIYFIYTSIDYSLRVKARLKVLDITLLAVFAVVVTIRILTILNVLP